MAELAIASGAVESPLDVVGVGLADAVGFTMTAAMGVGVAAGVVAACAEESVWFVVSEEDLLDDLPVDLPSPPWLLPDFVVEDVAVLVPEPAGLLAGGLALACWLEPDPSLVPESEVELVCWLDELLFEEELLDCDCDGALACGAGSGAGGWLLTLSADELLSSSEAKLSVLDDGSGATGFGCTLIDALADVSNVTLTTAKPLAMNSVALLSKERAIWNIYIFQWLVQVASIRYPRLFCRPARIALDIGRPDCLAQMRPILERGLPAVSASTLFGTAREASRPLKRAYSQLGFLIAAGRQSARLPGSLT